MTFGGKGFRTRDLLLTKPFGHPFLFGKTASCSPLRLCRRNERQSNSRYEFAKRQNVVSDDYGVSFVIGP